MSRQNPAIRTADEIRAEVIAVAAEEIASWESAPGPSSRHMACGEGIAIALAAAGLLVVEEQLGWHCGDDPKSCGDDCDDSPCAWSSDPDVVRKCSSGCPLHRRFVTGWTEVRR